MTKQLGGPREHEYGAAQRKTCKFLEYIGHLVIGEVEAAKCVLKGIHLVFWRPLESAEPAKKIRILRALSQGGSDSCVCALDIHLFKLSQKEWSSGQDMESCF